MGTPEPTSHRRTRAVALVTIASLFAATLVAVTTAIADPLPAAADPIPTAESPATVTTDPLPTPQINGVVWDQVIVGNTVYVGGQFTTARPAGSAAGQNEVTRTHLLAFNVTTGALLPWAPTLNAQVRSLAASPDGTRIYAGGDFTEVNGSTRQRIVAFNTATGAVNTGFAARANNYVSAVAATNSTVFMGGVFSSVTGVSRTFLAAANASDGQTTAWAPVTTGGRPYGIEVSPAGDKVVVGGDFLTANGSDNPGYGLVMVDSTVGSSLALPLNTSVRNAGTDAAIFGMNSDADSFYGVGYVFGSGGNLEGAFRASWATGALDWVADCHGDNYSVVPVGDVVYTASHNHYCGNFEGPPQYDPWQFNRGVALTKEATQVASADPHGYPNWQGTPAPSMLGFYPSINAGTYTGMFQGPWSVEANEQYVVYGGEFTTVNNRAFQGLVRFAVRGIAPGLDGPRLSGDAINPRLESPAAGVVRVSWPADWDRDDPTLTYQVIRDGRTASPVYTTTATSNSWVRPTLTYVDSGLTPGATHTYRIRVIDSSGNNAWSNTVSTTVATTGVFSDYARGVLADDPDFYYRLGNAAGSNTLHDTAGADTGTVGSGVAYGAAGAIIGDPDTAATFNGTNNGRGYQSTVKWRDNTFSLEAWIKTTSTSGGKIVGFGSANSGNSSSYDRHVYMTGSGRIVFGVYPNASRTISGTKAYNDGQWHHVVANLGADGMALYVDGVRVARNPSVTYGQNYWGYWRVGGDNTWEGAQNFSGQIDEVAVYSSPLTSTQILSHYTLSGRTSTVPPAPADAYGATVYGDEPALYWRLGETAGKAEDSGAQNVDGTYRGSPDRGVTGVIPGNGAADFGAANSLVSSDVSFSNPTTYSQEAWFRTTTTSGGKIFGFGNNQTGTSTSYDRHVYMRDDGRLTFGVWTGQENTITSADAYNDDAWHHVVATQSSAGMRLYVDGELVGTHSQASAQDYAGYWRVGGDTTWGGSSGPWFNGAIDEYAVYDVALTADTVAEHYVLGAPPVPNVAPTASFTTAIDANELEVDASASEDPDGDIETYAWDFGDGTNGTGEEASHRYTAIGTYTVTLTVTDDEGAPGVTTRSVEITAIETPPTASFTSTPTGLSVAFDAAGSADADGTIVSYAWDFGDGTNGTGVSPTHLYTSGGAKQVELTVTDDDGLQATTTATVTVTAPNQVPVAAFTSSVANLTASVNGSGSTDPDGTIASYSWNWGDGTAAGSGASTSHAYAAAGTYTITLTVTDDDGATDTQTGSVTVTEPPVGGSTIAQDPFTRSVASGWGSAPTGGAWTVSSAANSSVDGSTAGLVHAAGSTRRAALNGVSVDDVDVQLTFSSDKATTAGHIVAGVTARQISASEFYQARARLLPGGAVALQITRNNTSTVLANATIAGLSYTPGDQLTIRFEVSGSSPTTLKAKIWATGTTEPATWQLTTTDTTASLQGTGALGIESYISSSATNAPVTLRYDDYSASTLGAPAPNQVPVAAFTSSVANLTASVNGSGSTDPDGTIASYSWNWGDGTAAGSGASTSHAYAAAGTYTITLTVTDDDGATDTQTGSVTVTAPPVGTPEDVALDDFARTATGGWGAAPTGGAWTVSSAANSSVDGSTAGLVHAAGSTRRAALNGVSVDDVDVQLTFSSDKATTAGHIVAGVTARQISASEFYQARARLLPGGAVALQITRNNTSTVLANATIAGLSYTPGDQLTIRFEVSGSSPTTLKAKIWATGTTEPATWQLTTTDTTASLQGTGALGIESYISSSATNAPVTLRYDDYRATRLP